MIDTHAHINLEQYNEDRSDTLNRAWQEGLQSIIIPGIDIDTSISAYSMACQYDSIFSAVGIHPHHVHESTHLDNKTIDEMLKKEKVVALGEVGLDYYRSADTREQQIKSLTHFFEIAISHKKPLIIHCRDAFKDLKTITQGFNLPKNCGVLHCFTGTLDEALTFIDLGFMISLSGIITFKNAEDLRQTVSHIPLDRLLIETDSPYLAPVPFRGKRNEPSYVKYVCEWIAQIKQISFSDVSKKTSENAIKLFNLNRLYPQK